MTTEWQRTRLRTLGRQMIRLERLAQAAEWHGQDQRADELWTRRATIQWMRSLLLRDTWRLERR